MPASCYTSGTLPWNRRPTVPDRVRRPHSPMSQTEHRCVCGKLLRYKQDMIKEPGTVSPTWKCRDCETPVPGTVAEKISHQHPS